MRKIIHIAFTIITIGLFSCDNFLDKEPSFSLTRDNAITDFNKGKAAVGGIYSTFQNNNWSGALYVQLASKSGFVDWERNDFDMDYSQLNPAYNSNDIWANFYKSLSAANFAINGIESLSGTSVPSVAEHKSLIAEARCLRAWININIFWNFGHWWAEDTDQYGLLYRDQVVELDDILKARISVGESYQKIHEDLDYAIAHLNSLTSPRFVSAEFAKALKAKILLYRGGYNNNQRELTEALTLVNDVLNNSPAEFAMEPNLEDLYEKSWDSQENLFVRYLEDNGQRGRAGGYWYTYGLTQIVGDELPLGSGSTLTAGLNYGIDWFTADPRWDIVTGSVRGAAAWQENFFWTWKKLARLGLHAGQNASPPNEKYAAYYFRYAELYIMKSELLARTGASITASIAPINTMRSIRTNPVFTMLNPANEVELMNMIFQEYFLELFLENGSEFFASLRFNKLGQPWIVTIKEGKSLVKNKICWPIPDTEMINNTLMIQNPDLD